MGGMLVLIVREYWMLCSYVQRLHVVLEQYDKYMGTVKRVVIKKPRTDQDGELQATLSEAAEGEVPDEDEMAIDSLMVINRTSEYLKESTVSYLKDQHMDAVLRHLDLETLQDYTDQLAAKPYTVVSTKKGKRTKRSPLPAGWRATKTKRVAVTGINFILPIEQSKFWLSSFFGPRKKPSGAWGFHYGIDMAAPRGTPVKSAATGIVEHAGRGAGYGNMVMIKHDAVYKTRYAHLDTIAVKVGQKVTVGQKIGTVGDTGFTRKSGKDASHLHFELYERGKQVNPLYFLTLSAQQIP
jgi:murein DD-endopeptidase MepM/ murein hydrolase activator NlpD